jgi:GT2 family glycosyltransferase
MLLRREMVEAIGALPEEYFFGHEDREYSVRARRAGWKLLVQPATVVYHEAGKSRSAVEPVYLYNDTLSRLLFKRRTLSPAAYALWRAAYGLYVEMVLPLRHRLTPGLYMSDVDLATLRRTMRVALRDAASVDRVTLETLDRFRSAWRASAS